MQPNRMWLAAFALLITTGANALSRDASLPSFELPTLSGPVLQTPALQGQVVLVDFWASWCGPCKQSFALLNQMHGDSAGKGLRIVAINVDEQRSDAEAFLARVPAAFTIALDPAGSQALAFAVQTMPSSFLFGRDGRLRWQHQGYRPSDQQKFRDAVAKALAEPAP